MTSKKIRRPSSKYNYTKKMNKIQRNGRLIRHVMRLFRRPSFCISRYVTLMCKKKWDVLYVPSLYPLFNFFIMPHIPTDCSH
nr:MAG TPA: hypothetical protein [Caudoviricetes sp.]